MMSLWKIIRNLSAIMGLILLMGAIGTSDYYIIELGTFEPAYVKTQMLVGVLMIVPAIIGLLYEMYKEGKRNENN